MWWSIRSFASRNRYRPIHITVRTIHRRATSVEDRSSVRLDSVRRGAGRTDRSIARPPTCYRPRVFDQGGEPALSTYGTRLLGEVLGHRQTGRTGFGNADADSVKFGVHDVLEVAGAGQKDRVRLVYGLREGHVLADEPGPNNRGQAVQKRTPCQRPMPDIAVHGHVGRVLPRHESERR